MSETTANRSRTRRRVQRQAGPPADGDQAAVEVRTSAVAVADNEAVVAEASDAVVSTEKAAAEKPELTKAEPKKAAAPAVSPAPKSRSKFDPRRAFDGLDRVGTVAAVVALLSALLLIGSGGVFFYHQNRADALNDRRAEYIQVAKQAYLDLATVKDSTAGADIDRLIAAAGGSLKDEYAQNRELFKQIFEQMKIDSSGTILAAAIESSDEDSASVLLLARQTVSNTATNGPVQKDYRMRIHVQQEGDTLTATSVEFVP
ncbi:hypothetical protein JK358_24215 [Nocardia sp. 2]|uniref:Mce-associated membrane protein n=1 Tax=Nocardia acididurans TaxID=2802282 RepID=A0ABS1MBM8_9NOCA|nr:hypothetical protein [Nocardia acididurans]MBL1077515.1 hypothetical protein [Nocardia acididurans]